MLWCNEVIDIGKYIYRLIVIDLTNLKKKNL